MLASLRTGAGIASDISNVNVRRQVSYNRPSPGNVFATLEVTSAIQVVTVRQSEFETAEPSGGASAVEEFAVVADPAADKIQFVGIEQVKSSRPELAEAAIVVSGGRALKSAENFKTVLEPSSSLGAPWVHRAHP